MQLLPFALLIREQRDPELKLANMSAMGCMQQICYAVSKTGGDVGQVEGLERKIRVEGRWQKLSAMSLPNSRCKPMLTFHTTGRRASYSQLLTLSRESALSARQYCDGRRACPLLCPEEPALAGLADASRCHMSSARAHNPICCTVSSGRLWKELVLDIRILPRRCTRVYRSLMSNARARHGGVTETAWKTCEEMWKDVSSCNVEQR